MSQPGRQHSPEFEKIVSATFKAIIRTISPLNNAVVDYLRKRILLYSSAAIFIMAQDQTDVLLRSLIKMSEETAELCRLQREPSSTGHDNELQWFVACLIFISVASILAQIELKISSKDSNSVPPTKGASMKADATGTGLENSATTDVAAANENSTVSVSSSIPRNIVIALIWQAIQLILILYMGRNAAINVELIGSQFYLTAIILLAFAEFMILLSAGAVGNALSRIQADSELPGKRLETPKILELSVNLAVIALLWPWYSLWSASPKH
jgi:hypothetical protein